MFDKGAVLYRALSGSFSGLKVKAFANRFVFEDWLKFIEGFDKGILGAMQTAGFGLALLDAVFNKPRANRKDGAMRAIVTSPLLAFLELLERNHL
jgi:hypothetical protein